MFPSLSLSLKLGDDGLRFPERERERERETSDSPYIKTSTHLVRRVFEVLGESSYVFSQPSSLLSTPGDIMQSRVFVACGACVAMELFLF